MKQVLLWLRCQLNSNPFESHGRTRRFEFLEPRFCFSASGVLTPLNLGPIADSAEVFVLERVSSAVDITISEPIDSAHGTQLDPPATDGTSDEDVFEQHQDEAGPDQDLDSCFEDVLERNRNQTTVCEAYWISSSSAEVPAGIASAEVSKSQDDQQNEPSMGPGTAEAKPSSGPIQIVPQLHPIEQLNVNPSSISNLPNQAVVASPTIDSQRSIPIENLPSTVNASQSLTPSDTETLDDSPVNSVQLSPTLKLAIPLKPTWSQTAVGVRPQLSPIPAIMPQNAIVESRSADLETETRTVFEQPNGTEIVAARLVAVNLAGESDILASHSSAADELKDVKWEGVSRKHLLMGAIIAGWIAAPSRAKGRLVGRIRARVGRVRGLFFRRDKSGSDRPIVLEEAGE